MSVHRTEPAQPKLLCSLADLSQALDQSAEATPFAELGTPPVRGAGRRRRWIEGWQLGIAGFVGFWFFLCGFIVMGASARSPNYIVQPRDTSPTEAEPVVPQPDDPVQQGRGGRPPQVIGPLADAAQGPGTNCLSTRIAFVDGLADATRQAKDRNKLLMILNVSGDFDDTRFT